MPIDREKILQAAQRYVDKKRYDRAIVEYERIIAEDPSDARTLLKIGDLQARMGAYADAIGTYDRVGQYYSTQGFALKAIAVYKQIRELIRKQTPELADRYSHIVPKLAEIYTQLGLTSDALAAYDEVATRLQRQGKEQDAIEVFRQMVGLDQSNPLPYLRLAEACCRIHSLDEAIDSFWRAAELLLGMNRPDDALKVIERILHFRQDPRYARVAAELYLARGQKEDGLQALAKLQICFQADHNNLDTLHLLAQAFTIIGRETQAVEVYKEMARLARTQNRNDLYRDLLAHLRSVAPNDEQVRAMESIGASEHPAPRASYAPPSSAPSVESLDDEAVLLDSIPPEQPAYETAAAARSFDAPRARPIQASAPDVVVVADDAQAGDDHRGQTGLSAGARAHIHKALVDAESFRKLKLYGKAVEALHIALEIDPSSLDVRLKLREVLIEAGDREGAIQETVNIAMLYLDQGEPQNAEPLLYEVLEVEPQHPEALALLEQIVPAQYGDYGDGATEPGRPPDAVYRPDEPLPSYDVEEISAAHAIPSEPEPAPNLEHVDAPFAAHGVDDPFGQEAPLPSFPLSQDDDLMAGLDERNLAGAGLDAADDLSEFAQQEFDEAIEEALEEAEFFVTRGLYDDARSILNEQLARSPNHPLLIERLREVEDAQVSTGASRTIDRSMLDAASEANAYDDRAFDIAASLDALDQLDPPPSSLSADALSSVEDEADVDAVFEKFKAGVASQISENDSATHYNLGIAYKEMGLHSDAVNEFTLAARDPQQECMCYAMVGMIHLEQGELDRASTAYIKALDAAHKTVEQEMGLYYDLGSVNEMKGARDQALYYFQKIARRDPGYRDVKDRIAALTPGPAKTSSGTRAVNDSDDFEDAFGNLFDTKNGRGRRS